MFSLNYTDNAKVLFTDAESPSVRNFIANYKEEYFVCLIKKWSCWINKYRKFSYSRAVCHLSFKISVAFKYMRRSLLLTTCSCFIILTQWLFVQDPYTDVYLLWHTGSSLYLKFIWNFLKFLINKFPWKCKSLQPLFHF